MNSDDKAQADSLAQKKVTPQSAMDDYFDDMFGSVAEDPLQKLSAQQGLKLEQDSEQLVPLDRAEVKVAPKPKLKLKKQNSRFSALSYKEPKIKIANISPLIIPAAFPKLAPVETVKKPLEKLASASEKIVSETNTKVEPKTQLGQEVKAKLDAKTALAILEKQKSKLSLAQRQRLEEKLQQRAKTQIQPKAVVETKQKPLLAPKPVAKLEPCTAISPVETKEPIIISTSDVVVQKNAKPEWANSRFECLIFSVAGLKLAVPLISLGAIYKIEKDFIPLVGRASWFMGLYSHLDRNVRVVDTAQLVMPERWSNDVREAYKFIIRLGGNDWGMACDAVHESIQLSPDQVKWRTERTKRAWLFGTVIDHMCALVDADSLSTILNRQETNKTSIFS